MTFDQHTAQKEHIGIIHDIHDCAFAKSRQIIMASRKRKDEKNHIGKYFTVVNNLPKIKIEEKDIERANSKE